MIGLIIGVLLLILVVVLLVRTLLFVPSENETKEIELVPYDREAAITALGELIKCRTVSDYDPQKEDDAEFEKLIGKLPVLYPHVWETCSLQRFDGRALLFHWKGRTAGAPSVLMSHYDVVPVEEDQWREPPFSAVIKDGVMWGRGALDTKATLNGVLFSADTLIAQGFIPERDIYFAFSGGEEVNGPGAKNIVQYFKEQGIEPEMVVDEGGAVVNDVFPGVKEPCGLIGIAEKGMMNVRFSVSSNGGHASAPRPHTPVGILSKACARLENRPFRYHIDGPVAEMFDTLGRHSSFVYRLLFSNLWLFGGALDLLCKKTGGELNALLRTTVAFTQMEGSKAPNVIPPTASMVANMRLNPKDTVESATAYLKETVNDPAVEVSIMFGEDPSPVSRTDCEGWNRVRNAVAGTWKGCIVSPYLMVQCSDSRYYGPISDRVYRFSAQDMTSEERKTIHGNDERIRLETICKSVEFYLRLIAQC